MNAAFRMWPLKRPADEPPASAWPSASEPFGIFPLASVPNHQCQANTFWHFLGDAVFFRASTSISKGSESLSGFPPPGKVAWLPPDPASFWS